MGVERRRMKRGPIFTILHYVLGGESGKVTLLEQESAVCTEGFVYDGENLPLLPPQNL